MTPRTQSERVAKVAEASAVTDKLKDGANALVKFINKHELHGELGSLVIAIDTVVSEIEKVTQTRA